MDTPSKIGDATFCKRRKGGKNCPSGRRRGDTIVVGSWWERARLVHDVVCDDNVAYKREWDIGKGEKTSQLRIARWWGYYKRILLPFQRIGDVAVSIISQA